MFFPLHDDNKLRSIKWQYVTVGLIAANILVFVLFQLKYLVNVDECGQIAFAKSYGLIPIEFSGTQIALPSECVATLARTFPEPLTAISYSFLHADPLHLAGNMLFLWVFGDNVEDAMGHAKYFIFYILCAIFAALVHTMMSGVDSATQPLVGASGAVAGVIAAYLMLHPRVMVWGLAFKFFPLRITAAIALGLWILTQVVMVMLPQTGPIAWWAHIGGLIAGAVLVLILRRPGVPLFDKGLENQALFRVGK